MQEQHGESLQAGQGGGYPPPPPPPGGDGGYGAPPPPPGGYGGPPPGGYGGPPPGGYGGGYPPNPYAPPGAPPVMGYGSPGGGVECPLASEALKYAIVGIFCCGIVLGPLAIKKALDAKKMIAMNPGMTGDGKATAAIVIGAIEIVLTIISILMRVGAASHASRVDYYN